MAQFEIAMEYWFMIVGGTVVAAALLIVRARRRERRERDELQAHIRRFNDPSDPAI